MEKKIVALDYYVPSAGFVASGYAPLPTKGDVHGEHRVKTVVHNYHGRIVVVFEPIPK